MPVSRVTVISPSALPLSLVLIDTFCGTFQFSGVKVKLCGAKEPFKPLILVRVNGIVTAWVGGEVSTAVKSFDSPSTTGSVFTGVNSIP